MDILDIHAKLENLHCYDTGEAFSGEPYLWTVFFKIDGSTCRVTSELMLSGTATVVGTTGRSHGNLGTSDVDEDQDIPIPVPLGDFTTRLLPIPLDTPVGDTTEVGGAFGIAVVLMEEDQTPEEDIARGRRALTMAIQEQLNALIPTLGFLHQEPSEEDIEDIKNRVASTTENAVASGVGVWDWLSGLGDMDDKIGTAFFLFSHSQLVNPSVTRISLPLKQRWGNNGDWEITGRLVSQRPSAVTVSVDREFRGRSQRLSAGRYDGAQLTLGNDKLSSVRVPPGWKATLFAEAGFWGDSVVLTADTAFVGDRLNDRTSSIVVEGPFVTIYEHAGFQGRSQILSSGRYDVAQLTLGNDKLSSIRVPPGWKASLFSEAGFRGDSLVATRDTSYVGDRLNDRTSSAIVEGPFVAVFEHANFRGRYQTLPAGRYDVAQLTLGNDKLSSVRVPPGWKVTLFAEAGFWGDSVVLTADTALVGNRLNDRTSSIVVEQL